MWQHSGKSFGYTNWFGNEPEIWKYARGENFLRFQKKDGKWNVGIDSYWYPPLCQSDKKTNLQSETKKNTGKILQLQNIVDELCPIGWIGRIGIGCFYYGTTIMTWKDAKNHCKSMIANADLAEIHNAETNAFLRDTAKQKSFSQYWIGGSDEAEVHKFQYNFLCYMSTKVFCHSFLGRNLDMAKKWFIFWIYKLG